MCLQQYRHTQGLLTAAELGVNVQIHYLTHNKIVNIKSVQGKTPSYRKLPVTIYLPPGGATG